MAEEELIDIVPEVSLEPLEFKALKLFTKEENLLEKAKAALTLPVKKFKELKNYAKALEITGVEDKAGFQKVYALRQVCKNDRLAYMNNLVKPLKTFPQQLLKTINEISNDNEARWKEIEAIAQAKEDVYEESVRVKKQKEEKEKREKLQNRINALMDVQSSMDVTLLEAMSDEEYEIHLAGVTEEFNIAEKARLDKEEEINKQAEDLRLKAEELRLKEEALNTKAEELNTKEEVLEQKEEALEQKEDNLERKEEKLEQKEEKLIGGGVHTTPKVHPSQIEEFRGELGTLIQIQQNLLKTQGSVALLKTTLGKQMNENLMKWLTPMQSYVNNTITKLNDTKTN